MTPDPLRTKSRSPLSPTARPSLLGAGGISVYLYVIVAVAMAGYALFQLRAPGGSMTDFRVVLPALAAVWFAVRAGMMLMSGRRQSDRDADDDKTDEGA